MATQAALGSFIGCQGHKTRITLLLSALAAAPMSYGMPGGMYAITPKIVCSWTACETLWGGGGVHMGPLPSAGAVSFGSKPQHHTSTAVLQAAPVQAIRLISACKAQEELRGAHESILSAPAGRAGLPLARQQNFVCTQLLLEQ